MGGGIAEHQRRTELAGEERAFLLVDRAHPGAFLVVEHRQADGAGNVVLGEFRRAAHVDDGIKAVVEHIGKG